VIQQLDVKIRIDGVGASSPFKVMSDQVLLRETHFLRAANHCRGGISVICREFRFINI